MSGQLHKFSGSTMTSKLLFKIPLGLGRHCDSATPSGLVLFTRIYLSEQSEQSAKLLLGSSELGSPTPSPAGECATPLVRGGHTCLREKGWGSPNSDEGTYTVVLYKYMYFVLEWQCTDQSRKVIFFSAQLTFITLNLVESDIKPSSQCHFRKLADDQQCPRTYSKCETKYLDVSVKTHKKIWLHK
jgi:hypothetical protein